MFDRMEINFTKFSAIFYPVLFLVAIYICNFVTPEEDKADYIKGRDDISGKNAEFCEKLNGKISCSAIDGLRLVRLPTEEVEFNIRIRRI